jgi:hypothetical protein
LNQNLWHKRPIPYPSTRRPYKIITIFQVNSGEKDAEKLWMIQPVSKPGPMAWDTNNM